jgi:penicillin-insensitive murein DD-endopeptidase
MRKILFIFAFSMFISHDIYSSEAIGYYSNGSLKDAESIITRKTPIHKLFLQRKKFFTTDEMHEVINDAADFVRLQYPSAELLQIGDLSQEKGGVATGHGSHQNGLDVDIVYLTRNGFLQSPTAAFWEEEFVNSRGAVTENFHTERNLMLFKHLVTTSPVGRIFVDTAIKKHLCQYAQKNGLLNDVQIKETLRRLRPEALHTNHFHMRITCPKDDKECTSQSEVPAGTGCDSFTLMMEEATPLRSGC